MQHLLRIALATVLAGFAVSSNATPIVVMLGGAGGDLGHSTTFSVAPGVDLTVMAFAIDDLLNIVDDNVYQAGNGLGTTLGENTLDNPPDFPLQWLALSVNNNAKITAVGLEGFSGSEEALIFTSDAADLSGSLDPLTFGGPDFTAGAIPFAVFATLPYLNDWVIVAAGESNVRSRFTVSAVKVETPEPTTLGLAATALLGGLVARRRKAIG